MGHHFLAHSGTLRQVGVIKTMTSAGRAGKPSLIFWTFCPETRFGEMLHVPLGAMLPAGQC
jgi:hypothetical protein